MKNKLLRLSFVHFIWQCIFFVFPLLLLILLSFSNINEFGQQLNGLTFSNYILLFKNDLYLKSLWNSFFISSIVSISVTFISLVIILVFWTFENKVYRKSLLVISLMTFFVGIIPKTFVLSLILSDNGPLYLLLNWFSLPDPIKLYSVYGLFFSYVSIFLPISILLLFFARHNIPIEIEQVSMELGSNWVSHQLKIVIPLMKNGMLISVILVFILSIADTIIVDLIGGTKIYTTSLFILDFFKVDEWGLAAASSVVMLLTVTLLVSFAAYQIMKKRSL